MTLSADGSLPDAAASTPDAAASTPDARGAWLELSIEADIEAVEAVSEIFGRVASGGTSVEPAFELVDDGLGARIDPGRPATVRAYIPARDAAAVRRAVEATEIALGHLQAFGLRPLGALSTRTVREADWADAWKVHFPILRVGRRLVIRPTWRRHRRATGDIVIALDPGMAFGTGIHPTTRLCLALLERVADRGSLAVSGAAAVPGAAAARVLDVGCGSGILSIAAAHLGGGSIVGLDIDPIAVEATAANAGRNRLGGRIRARQGRLPSGDPPFDLVLANLIAGLLVELAGSLRDELRPGGRLICSGIFVDREGQVRSALATAGLVVEDRLAEGDWVALEALRPV